MPIQFIGSRIHPMDRIDFVNAPSKTGHEYLIILATMIDVAPVDRGYKMPDFTLGKVYQIENPYDMSFLPSHKTHYNYLGA